MEKKNRKGVISLKNISRRAVLRLSGLAAALALTGCSGTAAALDSSALTQWFASLLGGGESGAESGAASSAQGGVFSSLLPEYDAAPLTGEAKSGGARLVGVMVNNISASKRQNARPQRGLSAADLLIESRVEGGITRLCAVYADAAQIPEVGPIRSGRDQFLQLLMPWQALYYHDGESIFCTQFVSVYDYAGLNIGGKDYFSTPVHPQVSHRDSRGRDVAYEHTEFTSGEEIEKAAANAGISLECEYDSTFFHFADYRTGEVNRMRGRTAAESIDIAHSESYKTAFRYDSGSQTYKMSMYSPADKAYADTVDELNDEQLAFANVVVCFAGIEAYAGDSHDVQQVDFVSGGEAYLFTRGAVQIGRWEKPAPTQPLKLYDEDGAELTLNRGKTYLALVDDDEKPNFSYQ